MPLSEETQGEIEAMVRSGFEDRDRVISIFCEEIYAPGDLDPEEVESATDEAFKKLQKEKRSWPTVTDCDKLNRIFEALNKQGIIALQNAGNTQSDGYDDVIEAHKKSKKPKDNRGYCFYHWQDVERAVAGAGLYLAFGPIDPQKEETEGPKIGQAIVSLLHEAGFRVEWSGSFDQRIFIPQVDWKRR